ncbi:MAG: bifunctional oligoribonuclease/PAP phosphatase NrnA [Actinomycetota bacterium]|nr:bifunctional oligoribonuclease/PAP phosphatase NrnA [Actinomycetota bacterium]
MSVDERDWAAAQRLLDDADEVVLACHVAPDGDALGSMLGLGAALRDRGTKVVASWGSRPFEVPAAYGFLPALDLLVPAEDVPLEPDLLVTLDTGSADRLGSLADRVDTARHVLVLDHHGSNTEYGTVHVVDAEASATALVVAELLDRLELPLTPEIATPLYTGLVTDTGSFKHASTSPAAHHLAARLIATGIRHDEIARAIWDTQPFGYVRLLGGVCARARLETEAVGGLGLVWTTVEVEDLRRHGLGLADVEGVIDVLRTTGEAEVALVVKTDPADGLLKVSARSKGAVDVGAVCTGLGGGGHRFAAGFTSGHGVEGTLAALRRALADAPRVDG